MQLDNILDDSEIYLRMALIIGTT